MTYGQRLRQARDYAGLSQEGLAELSGVSQKTISKLERGDQKKSSKSVELAAACGVREPWLSREQGSMLEESGRGSEPTYRREGEVKQYDPITTAIADISRALRVEQRNQLLEIATQLLTSPDASSAEKGGS